MNVRNLVRGVLSTTALVGMFGAQVMAADITISGTAKSYEAYQVLKLSTGVKPGCGHTEAADHTKDCYSYLYTVNEKYADALRSAATDAGLDFDTNTDGTVSDGELIDQLAKLDATKIRKYADALYKKIKDMEPDMTTNTKVFAGADQGYWLIAETEPGDSPDSKSLVMLDTMGQDSIEVTAKEGVPTVTKKILVADETQNDGYKRVDASDVNVGEDIFFETSVTMPDNVADLSNYGFVVHDKSLGLTLKGTPEIFVDGKAATLSNTDYSSDDDCLFHVSVNMNGSVLSVDGTPVVFKPDTVVTLRYTANLSSEYVTANTGNTNEAWVQFRSDPYNDTKTDETVKDKVAVFTYKVIADKVDSDGNALEGADFTLYRKNGDDWVAVDKPANTDLKATEFTFAGLDAGTYKLVETTVPDGYTKADDVVFEIRSDFDETSDNPILKGLSIYVNGELVSSGENAMFSTDVTLGTANTEVVNVSGIRMPSTGEIGMFLLYGGGAALVIGGCIVLFGVDKKKKRLS